jgi:hypothetical protein
MNCLPTNDSVLASYTQWNTINSHYTHLLYICTQMVKEHNCNVPLLSRYSLTGNSPVLDTITWGSFNFTWECSGSDNCITNAAGIACTCQQCNHSQRKARDCKVRGRGRLEALLYAWQYHLHSVLMTPWHVLKDVCLATCMGYNHRSTALRSHLDSLSVSQLQKDYSWSKQWFLLTSHVKSSMHMKWIYYLTFAV